MKIKKNNDILDLLEIYDGVLIDWELHSKKYMDLYHSVYKNIDVNYKYKMFRKSTIKGKPFCVVLLILLENFFYSKIGIIYISYYENKKKM